MRASHVYPFLCLRDVLCCAHEGWGTWVTPDSTHVALLIASPVSFPRLGFLVDSLTLYPTKVTIHLLFALSFCIFLRSFTKLIIYILNKQLSTISFIIREFRTIAIKEIDIEVLDSVVHDT